MPAIVLVTGGTGLVGKAIEYIIENEPEGSRFGKQLGEKWIFASSRDADLRYSPILSRGQSDSCVCRSYGQGSPTNLAALRKASAYACHSLGGPWYVHPRLLVSRSF